MFKAIPSSLQFVSAVSLVVIFMSISTLQATPFEAPIIFETKDETKDETENEKEIETETETEPTSYQNLFFPDETRNPSQPSINSVVNYYYGDSAEPILADFKFCSGVGNRGDLKNQCIDELDPNNIELNSTVYLWMNYLVPKNSSAELLLHYNHNGITRDASTLKVSGSIRYRTWKKVRLSRTGKWEMPIYLEQNGHYSELNRIQIQVNENSYAGI
ncbi:MAG: hypothetical protein KUG82_04175 [Pseudomonadales bacterium]|nr:hypothetical protein [Pseudomonadales bacterium]